MRDYVYPSVYFAYFYFLLLLVGAIYFFLRSFKDGYWGNDGEEAKYRMLRDEDAPRREENENADIANGRHV
ncbi:MAG: hypothetical protein SF339_24205 [Blastocatellia bacterium]|nr:hypothetical protein [Blastocatellia bacterium]